VAGSGTFVTNAHSLVVDSGGARRFLNIAIGDINASGALDLMAPSWKGSSALLFTNDGSGVFSAQTVDVPLASLVDVALSDLNGDLQPDALFGCETQSVVTATNDGGGLLSGWQAAYAGGADDPVRRVVTCDLDGGGSQDVVAITELSGELVTLLNDGSGSFSLGQTIHCSAPLYDLDVGDLDGNGSCDAVVVGPAGYVSVMTNDGSGTLTAAYTYDVGAQSLFGCRIADMDTDGLMDIVVVGEEGLVAIGHGAGSGFSFATIEQTVIASTIYGLALGDCDVNTYPDIVITGFEKVGVLLNGDGSEFIVNRSPVILSGRHLRDVEVGDLDGNGSLDIAVCGLWSGSLHLLWNTSPSAPSVLGTNGTQISSGEAADLAKGTDFGSSPLLSPVTNQFTLLNQGGGVLEIVSAELSGVSTSVMWLVDMPDQVQASATSHFGVVFSPESLGPVSAVLRINNNGPLATDPYALNLAGTGVKRPVSVLELSSTNHVYDGTAHEVIVAVAPAVTTDVSYVGYAMPPTNAGQYTVTVDVQDPVYVGSLTGLMTVAQRPLTVSCGDYARGYGVTNPVFALSYTNFAQAEGISDLTVAPQATTLATQGSDVGSYGITLSGGVASNYSFAYQGGTLSVTQLVLQVAAENKSRYFGVTNPPLTLAWSGFHTGEGPDVLDQRPSVATTATQLSLPGTYPITVTGGSDTNYSLVRSNGTFRILAAPAFISLGDLNQPYTGGPAPVSVATVPTGLSHRVTYDGSTIIPTVAGSYAIFAEITEALYAGEANGTLVVSRAQQTITFSSIAQQVATNTTALAATASSGLDTTFTLVDGPASLSDGSNITFSASGTVAVAAHQVGNSNWLAAVSVTQQFDVVRAPVAIAIGLTNQLYDATVKTVTVSTVPGDLPYSVTYDGAALTPTNAGLYAVSVSVDELLHAGTGTGLLTVAQRELTVWAEDQSRAYGATNPVWTFSYTNFASGEDPTDFSVWPQATTPAVITSTVGAYSIVPSNAFAANYSFAYSNGTLSVTQAVLQVAADNKARVYGAANPPLTLSYRGWRNGDTTHDLTVIPMGVTTASTATSVGQCLISVTNGVDENYAFDYTNGLLTIYAATAVLSIGETQQVYNGAARLVSVTTQPSNLNVRVTYAGRETAPTNAGNYAVEAIVAETNYVGTNTSVLTVSRAPQAITAFLPSSGDYPSEKLLTLAADGAASGLPIQFEIESGPGVMMASNVVRFTACGTVRVTATQQGDSNWLVSPTLTNSYVVIDTNAVHYVAMNGQTSVWPYASWATAASNLQDAVDIAADGDRVLVNDGLYDTGGRALPGHLLTNRLCVTNTITVQSVNGPRHTLIAGQAGTGSEAPLGPDAMRGIYLADGAVLAGFSVTNGCTHGAESASEVDQSGGGILMSSGSVVSNSLITGNVSLYGGGAYGGTLLRCEVLGNRAVFDGGGAHGSVAANSSFVGNTARFGGGMFRGVLSQSTVVRNEALYGSGAFECDVRNTIIYHNQDEDLFGGNVVNSCAGDGVVQGVDGCITNSPMLVDVAAGDLYLQHESPCINAGSNGDVPMTGGVPVADLAGRPRIMHATVDMGAHEYDGTPDTPGILAATQIEAHRFTANWTAPGGTVLVRAYTVEVTNAVAQTSIPVLDGAQESLTVTGLTESVLYHYRVRAENEYTVGGWSEWTNLVTLSEGAMALPSRLGFEATYGGPNPVAYVFAFTNYGETAFAWSNTIAYSTPAETWLTMSPLQGSVMAMGTAPVTASVDMAGMDAGIYRATNTYVSATATHSPQLQAVEFTISRGVDTITFTQTNHVYDGSSKAVAASSASGSPVSVTYDGATQPPTNAGAYAVVGVVDTINWTGTNTALLTLSSAEQSITAFLSQPGTYDNTNVLALAASGGGSGQPVVFNVLSGPAVLEGIDRLRFTGIGDVQVTASQAGDANWSAAPVLTNLYTVVPVSNLVHYVAQNGQTSVWPYASWDMAAGTIQDAVDAAYPGDRIIVGPGVYAAGGASATGLTLSSRVYVDKAVTILSADGPETTWIVGAAASGGGNGPGAVRCANLSGGAILEGFMLTGGHSLGGLDLLEDRSGGGVYLTDTAEVRYCVLRDNGAHEYGGGAYLAEGGRLINCLVVSNETVVGGGVYLFRGGEVYNSTVVGNHAAAEGGGLHLFEGGAVHNTVSYDNTALLSGHDVSVQGAGPSVGYSCASDGVVHGLNGCITNPPSFVNAAIGDYHLQAVSPCRDAGDDTAVRSSVDLDGDPRVLNGVDMGADEYMTAPSLNVPSNQVVNVVYGDPNPAALAVLLGNTGGMPYVWSHSVTYSAAGTGWLTVTPETGVVGALSDVELLLNVDLSGLGVGNYAATNELSAGAATNTPQQFVVTLTITPAPTTGSIEGTVSYAGAETGVVVVAAYTNIAMDHAPVAFVEQTVPGPYAFTDLDPGTYYLVATMLVAPLPDADHIRYSDPWSMYTSTTSAVPVAVNAGDLLDQRDMALVAGTIDAPNRFASPGVYGDFDGDWRADPAIRRDTDGKIRVRLSTTGTVWMESRGWKAWIPAVADYDGDGMADLAWYAPGASEWHIFESSRGYAERLPREPLGVTGDLPVPADYDGDGRADPAVRRKIDGKIRVRLSTTGTVWMESRGWKAWIPAVADYDGDGMADLAWYAPGASEWHIFESSRGYAERLPREPLGVTGDLPVPADYDGDGKADPAVARNSDGRIRVRLSTTGKIWMAFRGSKTWIPAVADYDGDGKADLAWYVPEVSAWRIYESSRGYAERLPRELLGATMDLPAIGPWFAW
jgi:hypothetical protein